MNITRTIPLFLLSSLSTSVWSCKRDVSQDSSVQETVPSVPSEPTQLEKSPLRFKEEVQVSFAPATVEDLEKLEHKFITPHAVSVALQPYCKPLIQPPDSIDVDDPPHPWIVPGNELTALSAQFKDHPFFLAEALDLERRKLILLFEPTFTEWDSIQKQISLPRRAPVELRPSCYTRQQTEAAHTLVRKFMEDPAYPGIHSYRPEPGISGYRVFVYPGQEEQAEPLRKELGGLVNIWKSTKSAIGQGF